MLTVTIILLVFTTIISVKGFNSEDFLLRNTFFPYAVKNRKEYKRIFSHLFIHQNWAHLIFNMLTLFFVGSIMEKTLIHTYGFVMGKFHFLVLYFVGGIAAVVWPYMRNKNNRDYQSLGASGAISALLFSFVLWYPDEKIYIFFSIPIKAYLFGPLYLIFEYYSFRRNKGNVAHDAHIGGAAFGVIYTLLIHFESGRSFIESFMP